MHPVYPAVIFCVLCALNLNGCIRGVSVAGPDAAFQRFGFGIEPDPVEWAAESARHVDNSAALIGLQEGGIDNHGLAGL
ncbi:MAG: hypothetical protein AAGF58_16180 [Pseudomonadota bacterium]